MPVAQPTRTIPRGFKQRGPGQAQNEMHVVGLIAATHYTWTLRLPALRIQQQVSLALRWRKGNTRHMHMYTTVASATHATANPPCPTLA